LGFVLDAHSAQRLVGVHPDLVKVVRDCAQNGVMPFTFGVTEGLRTLAQQQKNVAAGASQTMRSRHLDGHAVDLVVLIDGAISWAWPPYDALAEQMKAAAARCNVPIEWGGSWATLKDGCHYQLPWGIYPSADAAVS
jgi:peptidoglycan L-alanyl-D-glutamate endopeptidase CwlK